MTQIQWQAIDGNDAAFDGAFFYGVKTTKRVCRPSCPARACRRENAVIFPTLKDAMEAGYTPCRRCCPERKDWQGAKADLAERVKAYIRANYRDKFSLDALSAELFVNGSYLTRVFRERTGCTPMEFHNRTRCEAAKEMLKNPELSVSYISDTVGYSTQAHFSRVFKEQYGVSPARYRKERSEKGADRQ